MVVLSIPAGRSLAAVRPLCIGQGHRQRFGGLTNDRYDVAEAASLLRASWHADTADQSSA
jgi:hypothetical protein